MDDFINANFELSLGLRTIFLFFVLLQMPVGPQSATFQVFKLSVEQTRWLIF